MKPFELHRFLESNGFAFHREGAKHKIYRNAQNKQITVPRHRTFRGSTVRIIEKYVREAQGIQRPSDIAAVVEDSLDVPESACEDVAGDENTTRLPPSLYEVYKDFVHFCEENSHRPGEFNIRDILIQNGHQLPDWNSLVNTAKEHQDISVLFDLQDALDSMKIMSHGLSSAIAEIEKQTAPVAKETRMHDEPQEDFQAAKIVAHGERYPYTPHTPKPRTAPVIAPVQRKEYSMEPQPAAQPPAPATNLSPRQQAYLDIVNIVSRLEKPDAKLVLQLVEGFVEMG